MRIKKKKRCTKCGETKAPTFEYFYKHLASKDELTPRCKLCVNEDNVEFRRRALQNSQKAARIRKQDNHRSLRWYQNNIEKARAISRKSAAKRRADPEKRAKINMAKRGGDARLTISQWNRLFYKQGKCCAICETTDPCHKSGWNTDHCHVSGKVRFILCSHCNRGIGAFKDSPRLLNIAAKKLAKLGYV